MSTFEHAGTTIEFLPSGKFRAVVKKLNANDYAPKKPANGSD